MIQMTEARTRLVLKVNAILSGLVGLDCMLFASWIQTKLFPGAPGWLIVASGVGMIAFALYLFATLRSKVLSHNHLSAIFWMDTVYVVASIALMVLMPQAFSFAGLMLFGLAALLVADFALFEGLALRQGRSVGKAEQMMLST